MVPTILYLAAVGLCLYVPVRFPPMYEGADPWIMNALAAASAVQASLRPHGISERWAIGLALGWTLGCAFCTPHLFFGRSDYEWILTEAMVTCGGAVIAIAAVLGVARSRALPATSRALYASGLLFMSVALVIVGVDPLAVRVQSLWRLRECLVRAFVPMVLGAAVLTGLCAIGQALQSNARGHRTRG